VGISCSDPPPRGGDYFGAIHTEFASIFIHLRRAVALPLYVVALVLSFAAYQLGILAAKITGDE
jgi:hypothetical protein